MAPRLLLAASALLLAAFLACGESEEAEPNAETVTVQPTASPTPGAQTATPTPDVSRTPAPTVPADWATYTDAEFLFEARYPPELLRHEQIIELTAVDGIPATELKVVSFNRTDGAAVIGVSITPNPAGVSLEEWIRKQPGWPCEPDASPTCEVTFPAVDGERGIRFSIDVLGQPAATVYVAHAGNIYVLHGNVFGSAEYPPTLTEDEFGQVLNGFRFSK
jgi:hypothetical protein